MGLRQPQVSRLISAYEEKLDLDTKVAEREKKDHYTHGYNGEMEPTHVEGKSKELSERVMREIRQAPADIREQLYAEAVEMDFTSEQVAMRAETLGIEQQIKRVPEGFQDRFRSFAERKKAEGEENVLELITEFADDISSDENISDEEFMKRLQEDAAKRVKKENQRKKALINILSTGYPECRRLLKIVMDNFGRRKPHEAARLVFLLSDRAIRALEPKQLESIIEQLKEQFLVR